MAETVDGVVERPGVPDGAEGRRLISVVYLASSSHPGRGYILREVGGELTRVVLVDGEDIRALEGDSWPPEDETNPMMVVQELTWREGDRTTVIEARRLGQAVMPSRRLEIA